MQSNFAFRQANRESWHNVRDKLTFALNEIFRKSSFGEYKKDFEVEITEINSKRSGSQLKVYWHLIKVVREYMNRGGNNYSKSVVDEWAKRGGGHYEIINGEKYGKSIANKSDCTIEDMRNIIEFILQFGAEHHIDECYIEDKDLEILLNYYR